MDPLDSIDAAEAAGDPKFRWIPNFMHRRKNTRSAVGAGGNTSDDIQGRRDVALHKVVEVKGAENVIELLTRGTTDLQIVSIVGMPGLGKTTMANYVYEHQSVNLQFHVRAWCCVSRVYNKDTLLADLLRQVVGVTKTSLEEASGHDLAHRLYQNLKGRRYLIVIDDIWDIKVWEDLKQTFPNDGNQSRILFTTRHRDVARKAKGIHYNLLLLSDEESCKLLCSKVFDMETCPFPELLVTSWRIAKKCKGLPLVVVLFAGVLRKTERRKECWEQVAERDISLQVRHENKSDSIQFRNILELSYTSLPVELRPCFLYFAAFPKDTSISASRLMELWISEGYVRKQNLCANRLKDKAKIYLDELVDRSLVMITKKSSNNGVKACHIHDVLREFCSEKSMELKLTSEESMFNGIMRRQQCSFIYYRLSSRAFNYMSEKSESAEAVFTDKPHFQVSSVRANPPDAEHMISGGFTRKYKFLKVLDLGKVRIRNSATTSDIITIATLIHLRFLEIRPRTNEIPAAIGNLLKLETLVLTGAIGVVKLPDSLWKLLHLRNILMDDHGFFNFQCCSTDVLTFKEHLSSLICFHPLNNAWR